MHLKSFQGKLTPFSTILDPKASSDSPVNEVGVKRGGQKEADTGLGKVIFEQFKQSNTEKVNPVETCSTNEAKEFNSDEMENLKKRRNPFECKPSQLPIYHTSSNCYFSSFLPMLIPTRKFYSLSALVVW